MPAIASIISTNINNQQEEQQPVEQQQPVKHSSKSLPCGSKIIRRKKGGFDGSKRGGFSHFHHQSTVWYISNLLYLRILFEFYINDAESYAIVFLKRKALLSYGVVFLLVIPLVNPAPAAAGQAADEAALYEADPFFRPRIAEDELAVAVNDPDLTIETVADGLRYPTQMVFLGSSDDILVTEQFNGTVRRIIEGEVQEEPLIDVAVANDNGTNERGLLGMDVLEQNETTTYVFIYYTESGDGRDGSDAEGVIPAGNRLYRYELVEDDNNGSPGQLINPTLLLDLSARPGPRYNGGVVLVTQDENNINNIDLHTGGNNTLPTTIVYLQVGDLDRKDHHPRSEALNYENGPPPDGTGGILVVDIEGNPLPNPVLVSDNNNDDDDDNNNNNQEEIGMLRYYFSYGLRNGFGMDIDPVTGYLWDTENGPHHGDEINLVQPGFNSGWQKIQGLASAPENEGVDIEEDLVDFDGMGQYSDPRFVWQMPVGVTAIKFLDSTELGEEYENDMFVGDILNGRIYRFKLNEDRTELELDGVLADRVANNSSELSSVIFGTGFRSISDIEVGPDGHLYILLYGPGKILKIAPAEEQDDDDDNDD